jgi:hypothetical protein
MFNITGGRGFHMTFANGYTISVQFGEGNYCTNRYGNDGDKSANAEVAAWSDCGGEWVKLGENDDVIGWQTPDQVLAIMTRIANLPRKD